MKKNPGILLLWLHAARPHTLSISVTPVVVGTALAYGDGVTIAWLTAFMALITTLLIQIAINLHNDATDFERGGDQPGRQGPPRVSAEGWIPAARVHSAALLFYCLAAVAGAYLAWVGGWFILLIGSLSLLVGWSYSGGARPISYSPLGEIFVFLFFGLTAVVGSYWLQRPLIAEGALVAGSALGLQAAAVLMVNNYRDLEADQAVGRRTLAIVAGRRASKVIYGILAMTPFVLLVGGPFLPLLALPAALFLVWRFWTETPGPGFNSLLAHTALVQVAYGVLLAVAVASG